MNAEDLGGAGLVAVGAVQNALDETLLEFSHCFFEQDTPIHHLSDKPVELIFHDRTLRRIWFGPVCRYSSSSRPVRMRKASLYLARVALTTSDGRAGAGGVLGHRIRSR